MTVAVGTSCAGLFLCSENMMDDQEKGRTPLGADGARVAPLPAQAVPESPSPAATQGEGQAPSTPAELGAELSDYQAGRNRRVQVTRRGWNRFDAAKKKVFLKWFAATA